MKLVFVSLLSLLVASQASNVSPVTRVVDLLKALSKQIDKEGDKEKDLFETFVCWGKSIVAQKTADISTAESKIDTLKTYISDLSAGRIELTTERADLEKEIEELTGDMEMQATMRKKEHADFLEGEAEMIKAVKALKSGIDVLAEATQKKKKGALLAIRQRLNGGMAALAEQQANLMHAVELGQRFLNTADALFLRRVLLGDVPKVNWKKLNRKATFKMAYKARSTKIQDVLAKMHATFTANLKDAQTKEKKAKGTFDKLTKTKQAQLDGSRDGLSKQESENGARGMAKQNSKDEVDSMQKQVANDQKFIKDTNKALADKKGEYKERTNLRTAELAAISKAINILYNDDARDLMKKSFASQEGFLFLQTEMTTQAHGAAAALREAASLSGDDRLLDLASALARPKSVKNQFGGIIKAIGKMIVLLGKDEQKDLTIKQSCEKDRMADTKNALDAGVAIDDMTDKTATLVEEIGSLQKEIAELAAQHAKVGAQLKKAGQIRKEENAAWRVTDKEDKEAASTVVSAMVVLKDFYKNNKLKLGLVQKTKQQEAPATWDGDYGGKTKESTGIIALLDMVHDDIRKDQYTAATEEKASDAEYVKFKSDSEKQMKDLMKDKNARSADQGKKQTEKTDTEKARATKKGELDAVFDKIEKINPDCEYYEVNYPLRRKNRLIEKDGLEKAKAILEGGKFTAPKDPKREMKPGDAFLQQHAPGQYEQETRAFLQRH